MGGDECGDALGFSGGDVSHTKMPHFSEEFNLLYSDRSDTLP